MSDAGREQLLEDENEGLRAENTALASEVEVVLAGECRADPKGPRTDPADQPGIEELVISAVGRLAEELRWR